jgi:aldose 1-epimerase
MAASTEPVRLSMGPLELVLAPALGGGILQFEHVAAGRRTPILRGPGGKPDSVLALGSFPLVPYVNRIRGGRFTFRGQEVTLRPNMNGDPSPLHGQGWLGQWRVESAEEGRAVLTFSHEAGEWPWTYETRQDFVLAVDRLEIALACTNRSAAPMPCGLGQHPYFHCTAGTRLDTHVEGAWEIDEHVLPTGRVRASGRYDLRDRQVCGQDLDHGFDGWGGTARMTDPAWPFAIEMSSPDARCFQLYSPKDGGIFVAEPVSHVNAALNEPEERWPDLGLRVIEPGETMTLRMTLRLA